MHSQDSKNKNIELGINLTGPPLAIIFSVKCIVTNVSRFS